MSPSEEVQTATGEAPERMKDNTIDVLAKKREALASARTRYLTAKQMRDEQGMAAEARVIDALLAMIPELEREATITREEEGRRKAHDWIHDQQGAAASMARKIKAAQSLVQEKLDALVLAIEAEERLRSAVSRQSFAKEVLTMRFDLPSSLEKVVTQPDLQDWATPVLTVVDKMRPSRSTSKRLVVHAQASDTPEVLRHRRLDAALKFVTHRAEMLARGKKQDDSLPTEVWNILTSAPTCFPPPKGLREGMDSVGGVEADLSDPVLLQAAAEIAALPRGGVSAAQMNVHRG